jgi:photosystem II stability/assembly factor-like uncharacterized protein
MTMLRRLFAILTLCSGLAPLIPAPAQEKLEDKKKEQKKDDKEPVHHPKFRLIGPAAGGRVSRACGVPGDPMVYYAAAVAGGVWKSTDGGVTWKSVFDDQPTSSIGAIAVAACDPNVVYVGSGEANIRGNVMPGNGIYKSTSGGKTWTHVWKQKGLIGHIIVHPSDPDTAFAAVLGHAFGPNPERGVYRTTDGGKTWQQVLTKTVVVEVVENALGGPKFESRAKVTRENVGAIDVCFDPNNPRILFAALWQTRRTPWNLTSGGPGSGLYRSEDGGDTWKQVAPAPSAAAGKDPSPPIPLPKGERGEKDDDNGLPPGPYGRIGVAVAPSNSQRVYALIEAEKGGLYRSDDGGEKWELVNAARYLRQRPWYFSTVHVDPHNADIVWCPNVRLVKSTDGGKTFKNVKGPHHVDHHDLWIDPQNPARMIDSNDGGVDITTNGGATWTFPYLPIAQFYHVTVDNSVPYRVMGNMQDQGTASGPSNSLSSAGISLTDWHSVGGGETGTAVADPSDPSIVYAGEYAGIITRYDHRTRQARNISILPVNPSGQGAADQRHRFQWTAPIVISPHDPKTIYHAANVLFRTRDGGRSWDKISPDLTRDDKSKQQWSGGPITGDNTTAEFYCTIFAVAESPKQAGILWAGSDDGLVHVSLDGGKKWTNVTKYIPGIPEWGTVCCIEASRHDAGTAFVAVDAHRLDDDRPYLWRTKDFGKTWTRLGGSGEQARRLNDDEYVRVVREDPVVPGMLYVGTERGLYTSRDEGAAWRKLKLNLPTCAVSDLAVKDNDLVVATNGRSLWVLDDLTPIRQWSPKLAGPPHLFPIQAAIRWRYHGENYAGEDRIAGENPPKGAIVNYYLPGKPKEELTLEVLDAKGNLVRKLSSKKQEEPDEEHPDQPWSPYKPTVLPKEPGINRVAWDLNYEGPTVIPGAKNDAGVPHRGPSAPPGRYTVKLTVDDRTLTGTVEVRLDPRVKMSPQDLDEQHRLAMQMRDDITRLSKTVIALQSARKQLNVLAEAWKDEPKAKDLVKQAGELTRRLDALEAELHNPKAEVTYDILAMKEGAKLYSQQSFLYDVIKDGDGPVTQGMHEVHADQRRELDRLMGQWRDVGVSVERFNAAVREAGLGVVNIR